jgi:hypothetical protein
VREWLWALCTEFAAAEFAAVASMRNDQMMINKYANDLV